MIGVLDRFRVDTEQPSPLLNRWLTALVGLFQPELATLLRKRDKAIVERRWRWRSNVLEDPRLEIPSSIEIDLEARLGQIEQRLYRPAMPAATARAPRLPRMSEGWGA